MTTPEPSAPEPSEREAWRDELLQLFEVAIGAWGDYADPATNSMTTIRKKNQAMDAFRQHVAALKPSPSPVVVEPTAEQISYPRDFFSALISGNSPYAFYIFQWVPYQIDAMRWRLKMQHDVRTFDGREAFNIWPNASSCGPFKDEEVEFIRISKSQFGQAWIDPRLNPKRPEEGKS